MGLEMKVKRAVLKELALRYEPSSKRAKSQALKAFINLTGRVNYYWHPEAVEDGFVSGADGRRVHGETRK
jgi:hypothetical protein